MPNVSRSALASTMMAVLISLAVTAPSRAQGQPTPQMRSEAMTLMQICRSDYDRLCSGITPGGGRVLACLQSNANQLSPACAQAMPRAEALKNSAAAGGVLPK
jgi:hypothetical protein